MAIIDYSTNIGAWFYELATGTTGSIFSAALLLTFIVILLCFAFRIPLEFGIVILFPLAIAFSVVTGLYVAVSIPMFIYVVVVLAQRFIF